MSEKREGGYKWWVKAGAGLAVVIGVIEAPHIWEALTNSNTDIPVDTNPNQKPSPRIIKPRDLITHRSQYLNEQYPDLLQMRTTIIPVKQGKTVVNTQIASLNTQLSFSNLSTRTVAMFRAATDVDPTGEGILLAAPVDSSLARETITALQQGKDVTVALQGEYVKGTALDASGNTITYPVLYMNKGATTEKVAAAQRMQAGINRRLAVGAVTATYMQDQTPQNRREMIGKTFFLVNANFFTGRRGR